MSDLYTIDKLKKHFEVTAEELLPSQSGNSGKFLTTDGSDIEWASVDALPSQSGNSGKYLTTNGETASWTTVDALPDQAGNSGKYLTTDGSSASWEDIDEYTLPTASSSTLGGVKVGTNLSIDSSTGVLSATDTVTTVTVTGEGNAITNIVDSNGALTATRGSTFSLSNHTHDNVYAPLDSPTFTGTPTAPTATVGTNNTQIATTAFVNTAVSSLVSSAPETLDTLNELAAALGNDPNFATTIASDIGSKLDSDSANYVKGISISGTTITVTAGDNSTSTLTTQDTTYTLPEATTSTLGGVIVGDGLSVSNGTISVDDQLPTQTGNSGKFLTTNGTTTSWSTVDALPSQTGNSGKYLTTNGSAASWTSLSEYTLPKASASDLGGIKVGTNLSIDSDGVLNATDTTYAVVSTTSDGLAPQLEGSTTKYLRADGSWAVPPNDNTITTATTTGDGNAVTSVTAIDGALTVTKGETFSLSTHTHSDATQSDSGFMSASDKTKLDGIDTGANNYSLPIAGASTLGGVKVGNNLTINSSTGILSADNQLPSQTNNSGKFLSTDGTDASWVSISEYSLPIASSSALGGIKVGSNLSIDSSTGVLSATDTITTATTTGDGNAVTAITATNGALTVTKGETFSLSNHTHDNVYAPLASPAFTGTPTAPTASAGTNSTQVATTAYVDNAVSSLVNSAPTTLDTLNELAAALGNDPNFATTISTEIGEKLDADSSNYVKSLSISGTTVTVTKGDDTTSTLTTQDTTYSAGDGITLTGTTFSADDQLPSQTGNAGKFLTTDGTDASWSDILNETKISSVHYPTANSTTVVLTQAQAIPGTTNKYAMSVYRNGIYLNSGIDYGYNNSTRTLTFTDAFEDDEIVTVVFSYIDTDSQVTLDIDVDEYEAGTGVTFTNNAVTNKVIINADDQLPSQTNNSGKFLTTNGSTVSWETVDALPDQTNNSGKYLTTNGTSASWATVDTLPSQSGNSGKFLTTNGTDASWSDILNETKISSVHYPTANATTIALTQEQAIPSIVNKYAMSVYRDGIYLNPSIDYGYNSSTRTLTFTKAFEADEIVTVVFNYIDNDSQVTVDLGVDEYEAGTGITFTNNAVTNKVVINADEQLPSQTNNSGKFLTTNGSTVSWETVDALPDQTNNGGKYLTTNGTSASWATVDTLPSQSGNSGKFLTTDGTDVSWATVDALPSQTGNSGKFLTTDGTDASWEDVFAGEVRVSSMHNPTENATTIVLTTAQVPANDVTKWGLSVYRDGIFLINGIDYTYASNSRTLTFTRAFAANEVVSVNFTYVSSDTETIWEVPTQTGQAGKFLLTDGTDPYWGSPFSLVREFNTTAGQNTLTLPSDFLTLNQCDAMVVFLDGIRLVKNVDYTFDSSTRVLTFVDTFISGDTVTVGLYANNYEALSSSEFPELASGILTSDGNSMSWKNFTKMVYTHDTTSANETVTIPQENLTDAVVTDVFRNGLLLVESDDYTIDSSTREITFVVPLAANEKIVVVTQNAIINSANLISGATIQNSTATTPSAGDNSTKIATTAFVNNALSSVDLSNYVTTSGLNTTLSEYVTNSSLTTTLNDYVTASGLNTTLNDYVTNSSLTTTLNAYVTTSGLNTTLSGYVTNSSLTTTLNNYATTSAVTTAINNRFANPIEKVTTITSAASITIDPSAGSLFTLSLSTNASITIGNISNGPYTTNGETITLYLNNTNKVITWNSKIIWISGEAPDVTSNPSIITFVTFNGGTNWYGSSIELEGNS